MDEDQRETCGSDQPDWIEIPGIWNSLMLRGQCHEIFDLYFFHEWNPSGPLINRVWLRAVLDCAESDSTQANTARSRLFREYLRKNEFLSKTIVACLPGAKMASIHEIKK